MEESKMEFQPWIDYEKEYEPDMLVDIKEPPCLFCKHWSPQRFFEGTDGRNIAYGGVRLCHADNMHPDFSCFSTKDDK